jgi:fatty acid amide hydrolase 2
VRVSYFFGNGLTPVDPELRAAAHTTLDRLHALGFAIDAFRPPELIWAPLIWTAMVAATGTESVAEIVGNGTPVPLAREWLRAALGRGHHPLYTLLMATFDGLTRSSDAANRALLERGARIRAAVEEHLGPRGVLVCLPYPRPAPRHHVPLLLPLAFSECGLWNALEMPATAVPIGKSRDGLPLGVQVVARRFDDPLALWVASHIERVTRDA